MKKFSVVTVMTGVLFATSVPAFAEYYNVKVTAKLTVSKSGSKWRVSGLNKTTADGSDGAFYMELQVYQNGTYLTDITDILYANPANLGDSVSTSDNSNDITCYAASRAAVSNDRDVDITSYEF